ncbi:MAG: AAA domain-containing protein, partial [Bacteroidota bacterium]
GQALGPSCWIAISRANRVIFAGDHQQLPPTVKSFEAEKRGLGKTLFEELIQNPRTSSMLTVQYRMHQQIMEFSSRKFYHGKLEAAHEVAYRSLPYDPVALEFVDTAGCGFEERKDSSSLSTFNPEEAMLVLKHLAITLKKMQVEMPEVFEQELPDAEDVFDPGQLPISIGLIAPYKAQIQRLQRGFLDSPMLADFEPYVSINTVDGFQGQERDVIYISLTRSNPKGEIGFLKNIRRMNVALTRARKKLVVVGDSATLGSHPFYADFLSYVENEGTYRTGWELMD